MLRSMNEEGLAKIGLLVLPLFGRLLHLRRHKGRDTEADHEKAKPQRTQPYSP